MSSLTAVQLADLIACSLDGVYDDATEHFVGSHQDREFPWVAIVDTEADDGTEQRFWVEVREISGVVEVRKDGDPEASCRS